MRKIKRAIEIYRSRGMVELLQKFVFYLIFLFQKKNSDRVIKLKEDLKLSGIGLEIGVLVAPIIKKNESKVYYVDYFSAEQLKENYKDDPIVDINKVEQVDFILSKTSYQEIKSQIGLVDYIVASHVFEHIPDPIGWLNELSSILKPNGILSLAIPDRRYMFDYYIKETTVTQLFSYRRLIRPSVNQVSNYFLNMCDVDPIGVWIQNYSKRKQMAFHSLEHASDVILRAEKGEYINSHCTFWTCESFKEIFPKLQTPFEIYKIYEPMKFTNEFIVKLRKA